MEIKDLLERIEKLVNNQKMPQEIKKLVDEIYINYNSAYKRFLANIQLTIQNNEIYKIQLEDIISYTNKDYENDIETSYEIEQASYLIKLEYMLDNIKNVINNIIKNKEIAKESTEKQKDDEIIKKSAIIDVENSRCAQQIKESIISEIESSKDALIMKLSNIELNSNKDEFLMEIEVIKNKVIEKLMPKIKEILDTQDSQVADDIIDIYNQFIEEKELVGREKFVSDIHVEVDINQFGRKIEQKDNSSIDFISDIIK